MSEDRGGSGSLWVDYTRQWNRLGPPLRPCWEDVTLMQREISAWSADHDCAPARALVLGSTPEYPALGWPAGSRVYAVDRSLEMINLIWYSGAEFASGAVVAEWRLLPVAPDCMDIVVGDGCLSFTSWPDGYPELLESIRFVLRPGGRLLLRVYLRPTPGETVGAILTDLNAGRIGNFNMFKWRLVTAVHGDNPAGVRLGDVWDAWKEMDIDALQLASRTGWPISVVNTINSYRGLDDRYTLPRLAEFQNLVAEHSGFRRRSWHTPGYDSRDRFRIVILERAA